MKTIAEAKKPFYLPLQRFTPVLTRESLNQDAIEEYAQALKDGVELDPIRVFRPPSSQTLYLACGNHRLEAHRRVGRSKIAATIETGGPWEAYQAGVADNLKHGAKLTLADRKKNAREFLKREPDWSTELIAKRVGLSSPTVESIRKEMASTSQILESGKRLGADGRLRSLPKRPDITASAAVSSAETATEPVSDYLIDSLSVPDSPSEVRLGGEANLSAQTSTLPQNVTDLSMRPNGDSNSASRPAASPGSTRGDTVQRNITSGADNLPVEEVRAAERRGIVGLLDTPKQDPTIAAKSATKLIREAQDALGQLAKKIDWLVEGTNNWPAYQETRRDLERIGKRLETWQSLPIDVTAA